MTMTKRLRALGLAACLVAALAFGALAASSGGSSDDGDQAAEKSDRGGDEVDEIYARGMELAKAGDYEEALKRFKQVVKKRKKDPDALNMMAFCLRKTGKLDDAFDTYRKALKIKPDFPQAREYLGEAHIQGVLLQIQELRGYGADGEKELAELVAALKRAAAQVDAPGGAHEVNSEGW